MNGNLLPIWGSLLKRLKLPLLYSKPKFLYICIFSHFHSFVSVIMYPFAGWTAFGCYPLTHAHVGKLRALRCSLRTGLPSLCSHGLKGRGLAALTVQPTLLPCLLSGPALQGERFWVCVLVMLSCCGLAGIETWGGWGEKESSWENGLRVPQRWWTWRERRWESEGARRSKLMFWLVTVAGCCSETKRRHQTKIIPPPFSLVRT